MIATVRSITTLIALILLCTTAFGQAVTFTCVYGNVGVLGAPNPTVFNRYSQSQNVYQKVTIWTTVVASSGGYGTRWTSWYPPQGPSAFGHYLASPWAAATYTLTGEAHLYMWMGEEDPYGDGYVYLWTRDCPSHAVGFVSP